MLGEENGRAGVLMLQLFVSAAGFSEGGFWCGCLTRVISPIPL